MLRLLDLSAEGTVDAGIARILTGCYNASTKPMSTQNACSSPEAQLLTRAREALRHVRHFAELAPDIRDSIARSATWCHFDAGHILYLEGEPAEALFILEHGWVRATRMSLDGREQAMQFLRSGEIFGDIAVFTGTSYPCTVAALEPVDVWMVEKQMILDLVAQHPELAMAVTRRLGDRVLYYIGLVEDLSLRSVEARVANTLLKHADVIDGRLVVRRQAWTTFDEMATRLGTVRDVLSRVLKTLEEEGMLRVERHEIVILDAARLVERGRV